jgi:hypothetical protein
MLNKYMAAKPGKASKEAPDEAGIVDDLRAFGLLRGVHERALMLELRLRDGIIAAFGYAWLEHAEFDPSNGIMLQFGGRKVHITGRNLNIEARPNVRLFNALVRHRVPWIHEADESTALAAPRAAIVIEGIDVKG